MNIVTVMGRLGGDVNIKTSGDKSVGRFTVCVDDRKKADGTKHTNFFVCTAFGKTAENISKFFSKGSRIAVTGSLRQDSYTDKDGNKRSSVEIIVNGFDFVDSKSDSKPAEDENPFV